MKIIKKMHFSKVSVFLVLVFLAINCFSEHVDRAPLNPAVIESLSKHKIKRSGDAKIKRASNIARKHLVEINQILNYGSQGKVSSKELNKSGKLGNNNALLQSKRAELKTVKETLISSESSYEFSSKVKVALSKKIDTLDKLLLKVETTNGAERRKAVENLKKLVAQYQRSDWERKKVIKKSPGEIRKLHPSDIRQSKEKVVAPPAYLTQFKNTSVNFLASNDQVLKKNSFAENGYSSSPIIDGYNEPSMLLALNTPRPVASDSLSCYNDPADRAADLSKTTAEAYVTEEVESLAEKLNYDPIRIVEFVTNNIEFEPSLGARLGAHGVLINKSANSYDHASLLLALLRASNIPSRYVRGEVLIDKGASNLDHLHWFKTTSSAALQRVLSLTGLYSGSDWNNSTNSDSFKVKHVWVEACIPYSNYRGNSDELTGHLWVPLDSSYKKRKFAPGIEHSATFDYDDYLSERKKQMMHEIYQDAVEQNIKQQNPNFTLENVYNSWEIEKVKYNFFTSSLPYTVYQFTAWGQGNNTSEASSIPEHWRAKLQVQVGNGGQTLLDEHIPMSEIANSRITLSFDGANSADSSVINNWRDGIIQEFFCEDHAGVRVVPAIRIDGVKTTASNSASSLNVCTTSAGLSTPVLGAKLYVEGYDSAAPIQLNPVSAPFVNIDGVSPLNYYSIQAYANHGSPEYLNSRSEKLLNALSATNKHTDDIDGTLGEFLYIVLSKYNSYVYDSYVEICKIEKCRVYKPGDIGVTSTAAKIEYLFDIPFALNSDSYVVDVPGGLTGLTDSETGGSASSAFKLGSYDSSAYESYVWQENALKDAISSVSGIQIANTYASNNPDSDMAVVTIASVADFDTFAAQRECSETLTSRCYPTADINALRGEISQANTKLILPNQPISYLGWEGILYIIERPSSMRFQINQLSGGYTVETPSPASYDSTRGTGYQNASTYQALSSSSASTTYNVDTIPSNMGTAGSGVQSNNTIFGDPVNMLTGNMYHSEVDLSIPTKGLPIKFERYYNSRELEDGSLGVGWTHTLNQYLTFKSINAECEPSGSSSGDPTLCTLPYTDLVWTTGSGGKKFIRINSDGTYSTEDGDYFEVTEVEAPAPTYSKYEPAPVCYCKTGHSCEPNYCHVTGNITYIQIKEKNGLTYRFKKDSPKAYLRHIIDQSGNTLTLTYDSDGLSSIADSEGRRVAFNLVNGRIEEIQLSWSSLTYKYEYDSVGNLTKFYSPLAVRGDIQPNNYTYYSEADGPNHEHLMESFEYSNGYKMTFEYYVNAKAFRHYNNKNESITFTYNDFIRESTSVDELGHIRKYYFNEKGLPTKTIEADGSKTVYKYDDERDKTLRTSHINPMGYETKTEYDSEGNITKQIMPSGDFVEKSHFTAYGLPKRVKNANGDITLVKYNTYGKVIDKVTLKSGQGSSINPDTFTPTQYASAILSWNAFDYNTSGKLIRTRSVKDFTNRSSGPYVEYSYVDTENNINDVNMVSTTYFGDLDGDGDIEPDEKYGPYETSYDELSKPLESFSGAKYPVSMRYDENGRIIESTDGVGNQRQFAYDPSGLPIGQSLIGIVDGVPTILDQSSAGYNSVSRRISSSSITGATSAYEYNARGQVIKTTSPDGYVIHIEYDEMGRAVKAYDAEGHAVEKKFDYLGRVLATTDPNGNTATHSYYGPEENGKLHQVTDAKGKVSTFVYNDLGLVSQVTDHAGRVTKSFYDALGRTTRIESPSYVDLVLGTVTPITTYEYNNLGHKIKVHAGYMSGTTDTLKTQATYSYDDFGRILTQTNALNKTWAYTYDAHSNVKTVIDPENQTTIFNYEYGGLLKNKTTTGNANGTLLVEYTYSALGQPLTIASDNVTYTYAYDHANRLESITDSRSNKKVTYEYSIGGLLNKIIDGEGNSTAYLYDPVGRLTAVRSPDKKLTSYMYDAGGRLSQKTYPNNVVSNFTYDVDNALLGINTRNTSTGTPISEHTYTFHPLTGYVDSSAHTMSGTTESRSYNYDDLGRILSVQNTADSSVIESFSYDPYGNRKTHTTGGTTNYYQHNDMHQIEDIRSGSATGSVVASFTYDNNGNQLTKTEGAESLTLAYDGWDRLIQANKTGLNQENYTYDNGVKRIATSVGGTTNNYQYSGGAIIGEYDSNWELISNFTHGPGSDDPLVRFANGASTYYHADALGSVVATTDSAGAMQASARYSAFGSVTSNTGSISQYGYTGREPSATGLMYYRARFYDPSIGRFTQSDPMGFIDGVNTYAYVANSPVNYTDPTGLMIDAVSNTLSGASGYVSQLGDDWAAYTNSDSANRTRGSMMVAGGHYASDPALALQAAQNLGGGYAEGAESIASITSNTSTAGTVLSVLGARRGSTPGGGTSLALGVTKSVAKVPGRVQSRINLSNDGVKHTLARHLNPAKSGNKSQFSIGESGVRDLLNAKSTIGAPARALETGNFARTITTNRTVGNLAEKMGGGSTNTFTVITDKFGNLQTAFPGGL